MGRATVAATTFTLAVAAPTALSVGPVGHARAPSMAGGAPPPSRARGTGSDVPGGGVVARGGCSYPATTALTAAGDRSSSRGTTDRGDLPII